MAVIIFLVYAALDHGDCVGCGDREGQQCWVIVMFLWLGLLIGLLLLLLATMLAYYGKKIPEEVFVENYYYKNKQAIYNQVNTQEHYEENRTNILNNQMVSEKQAFNQTMTD